MKKKTRVMILALATALTMAGTALASNNPATDVPADHWAYSAVTQLAKGGLIDGYGKDIKTLDRHEFAALIAKGMHNYDRADAANKALLDKLSTEFAPELVGELLKAGAKPTPKAETAKPKIWIGGETRFRWVSDDPKPQGSQKLRGSDQFDFRQRINFGGTINDDMTWRGRLTTTGSNKFGNAETTNGSSISLDIMNVTVKNAFGFDNIRVGRSAFDFMGNGLISKPYGMDGIRVEKKVGEATVSAWTGNIKSDNTSNLGTGAGDSGEAYQLSLAKVAFDVNKNMNAAVSYYYSDVDGSKSTMNTNVGTYRNSKGWDTSVNYKMGKYTLKGEYMLTQLGNAKQIPDNPQGWAVEFSNRKTNGSFYPIASLVNPKQVGSDAWMIGYRSVDAGTIPQNINGFSTSAVEYASNPYSIYTRSSDNVNVLVLGYDKVVKPGVVLSFQYQDAKIKDRGLTNLNSDSLDKTYMVKWEIFY